MGLQHNFIIFRSPITQLSIAGHTWSKEPLIGLDQRSCGNGRRLMIETLGVRIPAPDTYRMENLYLGRKVHLKNLLTSTAVGRY